MENKINIAELLKDCPKGMELDCTVFDNVTFDYVNTEQNRIYCKIDNRDTVWFTARGCMNLAPSAKCVILPEGKTTWEGFVPPCQFKDGDILSYQYKGFKSRSIYIYMYHSSMNTTYYVALSGYSDSEILINNAKGHALNSYDETVRLATEEEKQKLFDAIKANGYRWNAETKTLEELTKFKVGDRIILKDNPHNIPSIKIKAVTKSQYILENEGFLYISSTDEKYVLEDKFDITTLTPFKSEVLIRNDKTQKWFPAFWGYKNINGNYVTTFGTCRYCIPYEDNENLLSTADDCDDFYKTWE